MSFLYAHKKGFTVIEVVVVAGIIAILASVVLANMGEAKQKARDTQRVSDLQQIQTAVRVYRDLNSTSVLPAAPNGELYTSTSVLGTEISSNLTGTIQDPLNTGTNYGYYYNSDYFCNSPHHAVILALTMEDANKGNMATVCGAGSYAQIANGATPTAASYVIILK